MSQYQELFDYLSKEHKVDLLEQDMQELVHIMNRMELDNGPVAEPNGLFLPNTDQRVLDMRIMEHLERYELETHERLIKYMISGRIQFNGIFRGVIYMLMPDGDNDIIRQVCDYMNEKYLSLGIAPLKEEFKFDLKNNDMENTKTLNTMDQEKAKAATPEELGSSRNNLQRVVESIYSVAALIERSNSKLRHETGYKELIDDSINQSFDKIKKIHRYMKTEPETRTIGDMCMGISDMAGCLETMAMKTDERIQTSI